MAAAFATFIMATCHQGAHEETPPSKLAYAPVRE